MIKYFKKDFIISNWSKVREFLFLALLFSYLMLRLYNMSWIVLGDMIPGFDVFTAYLEEYGFPVILVALYIINLLIDKSYFKPKIEIVKIVLFIAFLIVSFEHITCLIVGSFLLCADFSSVKKISVVSAAGIIAGTLCVIWASQTGWTGDYLVPRMGRNAHNFGFYHYALWARQILFGTVFLMISKNKKLTWLDLGIFAAIQCVVFYYSTQRLTFVVSFVAIAVFILFSKYKIIKINNKIIGTLSALAFPAALLGTVWVSVIYDSSNVILSKINSMLNGRFYLQNLALQVFDLKPFAQQVHHVTDYYLYIDNGYMFSIYAFGLILTTMIISMFAYMLWRSCKTDNVSLFSLLIIILIYLLVDNPVCDLTCIGIALLFFPVLLKEHISEKN